jgi:hypothetical protein
VDWYNVTGKYHELTFAHGCRLSSLPADWQRELAAIWRLEADVNNGASEAQERLMPNRHVIDRHGKLIKKPGSVLPHDIVERIYELSYEFMKYPDDLARLGLSYYRSYIEGDDPGGNNSQRGGNQS